MWSTQPAKCKNQRGLQDNRDVRAVEQLDRVGPLLATHLENEWTTEDKKTEGEAKDAARFALQISSAAPQPERKPCGSAPADPRGTLAELAYCASGGEKNGLRAQYEGSRM